MAIPGRIFTVVVEMKTPFTPQNLQLRHERDITAQREAVQALERFPGPSTRKALTDIIEKEKCFWRIR